MGSFTIEEGYVFYDRMRKSPGLASLHRQQSNSFSRYLNLLSQYGSDWSVYIGAAERLERIASIESKKEDNFLKTVFGIEANKGNRKTIYANIVDAFNLVLGLQDDYENLKNFYKNRKYSDRKSSGAKEHTIMMNRVAGLLNSIVGRRVEELFLDEENLLRLLDAGTVVDYMMKDLGDEFFDEFIKSEEKHVIDENGTVENRQLFRILKNISQKSTNLKKLKGILSGENSIIYDSAYEKVQAKIKSFDNKVDVSKAELKKSIKEHVLISSTTNLKGQIGELISALLYETSAAMTGGYRSKATVIDSEMMKTDLVIQYSLSGNFVSDKRMQEVFSHSADLNEAAKKISNVSKRIKDGNFRIYESTKNYEPKTITDGIKGKFGHGVSGGSFRYDMIGSFLSTRNLGNDLLQGLVTATYPQMIPGAIGDSDEVRKEADAAMSRIFSQFVAELLFDDFKTIGNEEAGYNIIHLLRVTQMVVPLSFFAHTFAQAIRAVANEMSSASRGNANKFFHFETSFGNGIIFKGDSINPKLTNLQSLEQSEIIEKWEDQRKAARDTISLNYRFLTNLEDLIRLEL